MDIHDYENLNPQEQIKVFRLSPFKERGELIFHSADPKTLVRALSQEELYLVTKDLDLEEKGEIIKYASVSQLVFISDVECWKHDRLDTRNFLTWLETLQKADDSKLLAWLLDADYEIVVAGLKRIIGVMKPDHEYAADEVLGDTPYFTIDGMYHVSVEEENLETVKRALETLFDNHKGRYYAILEGVRAEMEDVLEEEAYRMREERLAERGFANFETANKLLQPISEDEFTNYPKKDIRLLREGSSVDSGRKEPIPFYPVLWSKNRLFLEEVLLAFKDRPDLLDAIYEELAMLSNKIIAFYGLDFSSEEKIREGVETTRAYVSLGLEILSGGDLAKATRIVEEKWLEVIFRWGVTQTLKLKGQFLEIIRKYWEGEKESFLRFLHPPYELIARGLLKTVPAFYDSEMSSGTVESLRDFRSLQEFTRTAIAPAQIGFVISKMEDLHKSLKKGIAKLQVEHEHEWTLLNVLGNDFVRFSIGSKKSLGLISLDDARKFMESAFEEQGGTRKVKKDSKERFIREYFAPLEPMMVPFWGVFFSQIQEEFEKVSPQNLLPEYFSAVLIKKNDSK